MSTDVDPIEGIAIVGMAGRFPGAQNVAEFWANLVAGRETIARLSDEQLAAAGFDPAQLRADPTFVPARGLLTRPEWFDAPFFGISPREAEAIDPQQRVFLEEAWTALEDAGIDPARPPGSIGVFAGMSNNSYFAENVSAHHDLIEAVGSLAAMMGNEKDYLATRTAYKFNLRGPALNIYTACSTSLVAVCQAVTALQNFQCDVALAGGVSITFPHERGYHTHDGGITSPDGHCRTFDASAAGTVFSNGVGVVVLKRVADALASGDHIYAVIKGAALNNDGSSKVSFTAPSVDGHAEVIELAHALADVSPETISYVEAHGTATALGDPIEIAGLTQAFRAGTEKRGFCAIGSVKTNIGHLDAAAGIAGLIKTALALQHRVLPASLHFTAPNPRLELEQSPFFVNSQLRPWSSPDAPRRAGVSSFGVGGTNAHVVLEEAPQPVASERSSSAQVLTISAKTATALDQACRNLGKYFAAYADTNLADAAFTLQTGRQEFSHRRSVIASNGTEAAAALKSCESSSACRVQLHRDVSVTFLFPGQGSQFAGMGAELHRTEPVFRDAFDRCAQVLTAELGVDLRELVFAADESDRRLQQTQFTQPALFATSYALAQLWLSRGISPVAMLGHSVGEYVAACLAGVFTLDDALRIVSGRAKLVASQPPGAMLAVRASESELKALLSGEISIAAINAPNLVVASGPVSAIESLEAALDARKIASRRLQASHAFHSAMLDPIIAPFMELVRSVELRAPQIPFVSNVTGRWITAAQATDPCYWVSHLREPVRFFDCLATLLDDSPRALLESGPSEALSQLGRQHPARRDIHDFIPSLPPRTGGEAAIATATGKLWLAGVTIDWAAAHRGEKRRRVSLPTYPFERQRYWAEPRKPAAKPNLDASPAMSPHAPLPAAPQIAQPAGDGLLAEVVDELQKISGFDLSKADPSTPFIELGFDSLFLTQASLALQRRFRVPITFRRLMEDVPSPRKLAEWLESRVPSQPAAEAPKTSQPKPDAPAVAPAPTDKAHGPFRRIDTSAVPEFSPKQREHLDTLIARYTAHTAGSKRHTQTHRAHLADPRAVAGFKRAWKEMIYPIVAERSEGSHIWDIDGNDWIDVTLGFGQSLLGHRPKFVIDAVEKQLHSGFEIGPTSPLAGEVAALVCEFTGHERAAFCNTGSEAVTAAIRVARTVTGRSKIVVFAGAYHGITDEVLVRAQSLDGATNAFPIAPGIEPDAVQNVILLDYGSDEALAIIRARAEEIAAVLVEPVQSRRPELQPREFLHELRRITADAGTALVFDEVVTGFRVHPGGAQASFDVKADLATYGKVIGGGLPIGIVAGSSRFMDALDGGAWSFGDDSFPEVGVTFFAGTFVRHPLALAATKAVLEHLKSRGPELQRQLTERTTALVAEMNAHLESRGVPLRWTQFSSMYFLSVPPTLKHASLLWFHLRARGIHAWESRPSFLSTAHTAEEIAQIAAAFRESVDELVAAGFLPGNDAPQIEVSSAQVLALTDAQEELFVADRMGLDASRSFNESITLHLHGALDVSRLRRAIDAVVARHDVLRAQFAADGRTQTISREITVELPVIDASDKGAEQLAAMRTEESSAPFDITTGPLFRARLLRLSNFAHDLILTVHHIVCDGWSFGVVASEIAALYREEPLPEPAQFAEYATWIRAQQSGPEHAATRAFWLKKFAKLPPPLELPVDHARKAVRSYRGGREAVTLPATMMESLRRFSASERCTVFTTMLAAFDVLLHRLSGQADLVVGIAAAGQAAMGRDDLVGHCLNFLPIRAQLDPDESFSALLARLRTTVLDAFEHQNFTFGTLLQKLSLPRDASRMPLLGATFNIDRAPTHLDFGAATATMDINPKSHLGLELSFNIVETAEGTQLYCAFNRGLFEPATVRRWLSHYLTLLDGIIANPSSPIATLPLLKPAEISLVTETWNATARPFPAETPVHALFAQQARQQPNAVAIVEGAKELTYSELDAQSDAIAFALVSGGVQPGGFVGLAAERNIRFVARVLGILKAGCAYISLDTDEPAERVAAMRAACDFVIDDAFAPSSEARPLPTVPASAAAYVIYTSGSTGVPKGVVVPHRAITRLVVNTDYVEFAPSDVVALASNVCFDAVTFELWGALLNGARLIVTTSEVLLSPRALAEHIEQHGITTLFLTTSLFNQMAMAEPAIFLPLKTLVFGGEEADATCVRRVLESGAPGRLVNGYGPTETTTFAVCHVIKPADAARVPIGRPIANTTAFIFDSQLNPVPIGVTGELFIGGPGVAIGYHRAPELTASRFIETRFGRLYKTGDLAAWLPDGLIEYRGRADQQIKLRGFRIEPGEIECALQQHAAVKQAAVTVQPGPAGEKSLVAYVVRSNGALPSHAEFGAFLRDRVPAHMIPTAFVGVEALPLTPNGKLDVRALPAATFQSHDNQRAMPPQTLLEAQILEVWEEVLGRHPIGIRDDFFELGGHSLLAARMLSQIEQRIGGRLSLPDLFESATIEAIARRLLGEQQRAASEQPYFAIHPEGKKRPLFFLHGDFTGGGFFARNIAQKLDAERPFYAIHPHGLLGDEPPNTIAEMAHDRLAIVRKIQPHGPYLLGGYCNGALIAYEMACLLEAEGEKVQVVAMLVADGSNYALRHVRTLANLFGGSEAAKRVRFIRWQGHARFVFWAARAYAQKARDFAKQDRNAKAQRIVRKVRRVVRRLMGRADPSPPQDLGYAIQPVCIGDTFALAVQSYVPSRFNGRIALFWPRDERPLLGDSPSVGWSDACANVEEVEIPGDHDTSITLERNVRELAAAIRRSLDALDDQTAAPRPQEVAAK